MLCGLDPSFNRTGISIYNGKSIIITSVGVKLEEEKTFCSVYRSAELVTRMITEYISNFNIKQVITEVPPPLGQFSSGLWCLDSLLCHKLENSEVEVVYTLNPNYIEHVHGKRGHTKTESVELAKKIIKKLETSAHVKTDCGRLNHDEAESLIFLCRLFVINNMFVEELQEWKGLLSSKERLLGGNNG